MTISCLDDLYLEFECYLLFGACYLEFGYATLYDFIDKHYLFTSPARTSSSLSQLFRFFQGPAAF